MKNTQIGLTEEYPYCIRDGEVYCSTLCKNGKWERSPNDNEVKAFDTKQSAEDYATEKGFTIAYEIVIPYKEWETGTGRIKELLNDEDTDFDTFYQFLQDNDIGNWDKINHEEIIKQYINDMIGKGVHVSHILKVLEEHPSEYEVYKIWLGNSMETPIPINSKKDLFTELELQEA